MKKLFIPFKEAVELKELGFDENTLTAYSEWKNPTKDETDLLFHIPSGTYKKHSPVPFYGDYSHRTNHIVKSPTWDQAFDFFRETYKLDSFCRTISYENKISYWKIYKLYDDEIKSFSRSENSLEIAKINCLRKLIQIAKNDKLYVNS